MVRLYHREHAGRPLRVAWTLEEIGAPYEITVIDREHGRLPEHLARHPLGRVPVLEIDGRFLFESAAICLHLCDLHADAGLVPPPGTWERALSYQWLSFVPAELEPPLIETALHAESDPERSALARKRLDAALAAVERALGEREHIVGESFGVADVLVGTALAFTSRVGLFERLSPNLQEYVARLAARPARRRALARTGS